MAARRRHFGPAEAQEGVYEVNPILKKYGGRSNRGMSRRAVAEQESFNRAVGRHLRSRWRATPPLYPHEPYVVQTAAGRLFVRPNETWIALRFEHPTRATHLPLAERWQFNDYSGKWNIHLDEPNVAENLRELDRRIASAQGARRDRHRSREGRRARL